MDTALVVFVSLYLLTLFTDDVHSQSTITCDAGTGYIGQPSNITCTFHKDVKVTQTAVSIVMTPFTLRRDEEEREVLQCSWPEDKDKPLCLVTPGYAFSYDVTQRLTVEIPYTTRGYAGRYACHVVPPDGATVQTCELIVTEEINTSPPRQQPMVSIDSGNSMNTPILILLILLVLLVLPVFIVSLCYAWKNNLVTYCTSRLHSTSKKKALEQEDPEQQDPEQQDPEAKDPAIECQTPPPYAKVSRYAKSRRTDYEEVTEDMLDPLLSASTTESPQANPPVKDNKLDPLLSTSSTDSQRANANPPAKDNTLEPLQSTSSTESPNSNANLPAKTDTPSRARKHPPATFTTTASITVNTSQPAVSFRTVEKQERLHDDKDNERDQDGDLTNPSLIPAARSAKEAPETSPSAASSDSHRRQPARACEEERDAEASPTPRENRSAVKTTDLPASAADSAVKTTADLSASAADSVVKTTDLPVSAADSHADRKPGHQGEKNAGNVVTRVGRLKSYPAPPPPFKGKD